MKSSFRLGFLVSAIAILFTGCGGGGGSDPAPVTVTPQALASLNAGNQTAAVQDALSTAFAPFSGAQSLTGVQATNETVVFDISRQQLDRAPEYFALAKTAESMTGVSESVTKACPQGGSMTISANDGDNSGTVSAGDSLNIAVNGCVLDTGTATGSMGFTFNTVSGDYQSAGSSNYSLGVTMTFGEFTATTPSGSASINGSLSLFATSNGINNLSTTISTPSLAISANYGGELRSVSLTGYSATMAKSPSATYGALWTYTVSGTASSSALDSRSVSFATSTPFIRRAADAYPSSGVFMVTGGANSAVKITALDNSQVTQELDADGDGVYEESTTKAWSTLM